MKFYPKFWLYAGAIPFVTVILDQLSKYAILDMFQVPFNICEINPFPGLFKEVSPVVDFALVCNQGVSFGLFSGDSMLKRWLLTSFAVVMCCILLYALSRTKDFITRLSIGLIIGGAIGNAIDRALYGAVTDFISVEQLIPFFPWVFNIADSAITCGVIGLFLAGFFTDEAAEKPAGQA